jgi:hypothetical protein
LSASNARTITKKQIVKLRILTRIAAKETKSMIRMQNHFAIAVWLSILAALLITAQLVNAQPIITECASGFSGFDTVIRKGQPHDAFIAFGSVVKHISRVSPGSRSCSFGPPLPDIALGELASWGVALDNAGNLYVAAGSPDVFTITDILRITPPYTGAPTVFYSAAVVPGVFGIFAAGVDDLFVTSNAGFTGCASGVGSDDVKHVTTGGVETVATGLSFPEGIGGDEVNLYIAAGAVVFTVPITGGTPSFYAGSPILFSHGVTVWKGGGYVTDSNPPGHVFKFTLL